MIELVFKLLYALIDITFDFLHAITPNISKYKERLNKRRLTQPAMPPKSNNNMFKKLINFIIDCFPSIKEYKEKRKKEKLEQKEWEQKIDEMMADYEPTSFDDETQFCVRPSDDEKEDDETCSWVPNSDDDKDEEDDESHFCVAPSKEENKKPHNSNVRYSLSDSFDSIKILSEDVAEYGIKKKTSTQISIADKTTNHDLYKENDVQYILKRNLYPNKLERCVNQSFVGKLLEIIRNKNMTDKEVYTAAQIDRRYYSKIVSNELIPAKSIIIQLALALKLDLNATQDLLERAGYALSHSIKRDVIIEYFIKNNTYDIITINEALDHFGEKLLGKIEK